MATVKQILGDDLSRLKGEGKSNDEIIAIAKDRLKNPPQTPEITPPPPQKPFADQYYDNMPDWYKGESGNGLIDFGADVLRGAGHTGISYANALGIGDPKKMTARLQALERVTEEHKAEGRTPERQAEVDALHKKAASAKTFGEKFGAGVDILTDTLATPSEWQVGTFIGENLDPINTLPIGKGIVMGATVGGLTNGVQAGVFNYNREDKTGLDTAVDIALGTTAGVTLGGVTGALTRKGANTSKSNKDQSDYDAANEAFGVDEKDAPLEGEVLDKERGSDLATDNITNPFDIEGVDPVTLEAEIVKRKTYEVFRQVIQDEELQLDTVDAQVKQLGAKLHAQGLMPEQVEAQINAVLAPSPEAKMITHIVNDGQPLAPRLNGLNIQKAVMNAIEKPLRTTQEFYEAMIGYGAVEQLAVAATKAYETKEIAHLSVALHDKLAAKADQLVDMPKIKEDAQLLVHNLQEDNKKISNSNQKDIISEDAQVKADQTALAQESKLAHDKLSTETKRTPTQQSDLFGQDQKLFDVPSETALKTPKWAEPLVTDATRYEDIVRDVTAANNGEKPTPLAKRAMAAMAADELKGLTKHDRFKEVLDYTRDSAAADGKSPQKLVTSRHLSHENKGDGYESSVTGATYEKNYAHDFALSKAKVKRIESGKPTLQDIEDLKTDLAMVEENPDYRPVKDDTDYEAFAASEAPPLKSISDLVEVSYELRDRKLTVDLGKIPKKEVNNLKEKLGIDVENYHRVIDNYSINHIMKKHGSDLEYKKKQIPITKEDLSKIPELTKNANKITLKKNQRNMDVIKYETRLGDDYFYLEEVRTGKKQLVPVTMYKRKAKGGGEVLPNNDKSSSSDLLTSETTPPLKDIIAKNTEKIEDFGEKIGGARKDLFKGAEIDTSKFDDFTNNELHKNITKAKVFRAVDYRELAASFEAKTLYETSPDLFDAVNIKQEDAPLLIAHFVKTIKDSIQTPKKGWSAQKYKEYIAGVERVKSYLLEARDVESFKGIRNKIFGEDIVKGRYINSEAQHYNEFSALGSKFNSAMNFGTSQIRKSAREVNKGWMASDESKTKNSPYEVAKDENTGEYMVTRKKASWNGNLVADGFKSEDDALRFIETYDRQEKFRIYKAEDGTYDIGRKYSDGRYAKLSGNHASEAAARETLSANIDKYEKMKGDDIARREMVDTMTYGRDHREGKDVTPEYFNDTFGFRGVEFGNWNTQKERQLNLNRAFDALSDLSELLGIPQRAISLNGELALAFGARGKGGKVAASAHYEPERVVINLTKKSGAGSLAHEWAHALDNYFGKKANTAYLSESYKSGDVRAELYDMYKEVIDIAMKRDATELEMGDQYSKTIANKSKNVQATLNRIRENLTVERRYGKKRAAATPEQLKAYDDLVTALIKRDTPIDVTSYKTRLENSEMDAINAAYKAVMGRTMSNDDYNSVTRNVMQLRAARLEFEKLQAGFGEAYKVPTDFIKQAQELDRSRSKPYWSTTREVFARVFEAYVGDRLRDKGIKNSYLVSGIDNPYAYPLAKERVAINNALHKMTDEMKYRDAGDHVELYSEVIPNIRKVASFLEYWDDHVDAVYDIASNFLRGVDAAGNVKPQKVSNYKVVNWAKDVGGFLRENFVLGGSRSSQLIDMMRNFTNHKSMLVNDAIKMREGFANLSKRDNQNLVRALGGDMDLADLNQKLRPVYNKFRAMIDDHTDALVAAGALDPKYARENYLKRYYFEHLKEGSFFDIFKGGTSQTAQYKRKNMSLADRIAKGQIEDAGYVISKTILEQRDQLLRAEFFNKLDEAYSVDAAKEGYVQVPDALLDGGVKKYGALNGKHVPHEVFDMIKASFKMKQDLNGIEKVANYWVKSVQHIKTNMTVKNAGTHLYNVLSNGYIAYLDGHMTQLARVLKDKRYYDTLKGEAQRFGLDTMLDDMEAQFFKEHNPDQGVLAKLYHNAYMAEGSKLGDAMRQAYEFEDVAFKLAAYAKRREAAQFNKFLESRPELVDQGVINDMFNAHKYRKEISEIKLSEAELEAAFKEVDSIYVNYGTELPKGVAGLDRSGLMPFMHYSWKATPIFLKLMAKHPLKVGALHLAFASFGASKIIGEQDERDKVTPEYMNNGINILGVDNFKEVSDSQYLNIGRSVPAMRFMNISPVSVLLGMDGGILSNVVGITTTGVDNKGYSVDGRTTDTPLEKLAQRSAALSEQISPPLFPAIPMVVRQKRQSNGKEIAGETEVVALGGRYFQKLYDALGGKKDKQGEPLKVSDVVLQAAGLKTQRADKGRNAQKSVNKARKAYERAYNMAKTSKERAAAARNYRDALTEIRAQLPRALFKDLKINKRKPTTTKGGKPFKKFVAKSQIIKF